MLEKSEKQLLHIYSSISIKKKRNHKIKILVLKEKVFFVVVGKGRVSGCKFTVKKDKPGF